MAVLGGDIPDAGSRPAGAAPHQVGGFELLSRIGHGAMGAVFRARQTSLDRIVALKILPPAIAKDSDFIERFVREARASAKLSHPNVVAGIDVGQDPKTGLWYFAMEFIDGPTVLHVLTKERRIPEDRALSIACDIARALDCAQQHGLVHRDIKPDNILLTDDGTAKLADLGLARQTDEDVSLTRSGQALGTPLYMAPEQARGENETLDTRADLYALGATLFHMVTGRPPFTGETAAVIMAKHLTEPPPPANSVHAGVSVGCSRLIQKLMQKSRARRFQTPAELLAQLERLLKLPLAARGQTTTGPRLPIHGSTTEARDVVPCRVGRKAGIPVNGRGWIRYAGLGVGAVVVVGLVLAWLLWKGGREDSVRTQAMSAVGVSASTPGIPAVAPERDAGPEEAKCLEAFRVAQAFAASHPESFVEILEKYGVLRKAARNFLLAGEIDKAIAEVDAHYGAAAERAWADLETRIKPAVAAGDYDTALAATFKLPDSLALRLRPRLIERRDVLEGAAWGQFRAVFDAAEAFSKKADLVSGLKALEAVAGLKYKTGQEALTQLRRRLQSELADANELKKKEARMAARGQFEHLLEGFDRALLVARDEAAAREVADRIRAKSWPDELLPGVKALGTLLSARLRQQQVREAHAAALKGQPFEVGQEKGTFQKIENGSLYLAISKAGGKLQMTQPFAMADLSDEQRARLSPPLALDSDEARVAAAIDKLVEGQEDLVEASALLERSPSFPLTPHYRRLIRLRQVGPAEVAAEEVWLTLQEAARSWKTDADGAAVRDGLGVFLEKHGSTKCAKQKSAEIAALRKRLERMAADAAGAQAAGNSAATQRPVFRGEDAKTQGNWKGVYGRTGYVLPGIATELPAFVKLKVDGTERVFNEDPEDTYALALTKRDGRIGSQWCGRSRASPMVVEVNLTDGQEHRLTVYMYRAVGMGARQQVDLVDAVSGSVLDRRTVAIAQQGRYLTWSVKGAVRIHVYPDRITNWVPVLNGIFID